MVRQWQLARWTDGSTHLWLTRRRLIGRGEADGGLRYHIVTRTAGPLHESTFGHKINFGMSRH